MTKYICIHGHFYQPPRENPWLNKIELQPSAAPYHNWNERIAEECYARNSSALTGDEEVKGTASFNNYSRLSFDFGPTLLSWLERWKPGIYRAVLDADRLGIERFSGHGPAIAQAYNHMILPLANKRDKYTQLVWGIRDFSYRFGRKPEGIWLPETAVDTETLEFVAQLGIRFTILAPHQVLGVRRDGGETWRWLEGRGFERAKSMDTTMPYLTRLPGGEEVYIFFYDYELSKAVSFGGLLNDRKKFLRRLLADGRSRSSLPSLKNIATDGETFGHHFRGGEKALAYVIERLEASTEAEMTIYGEFIELFPPSHEVKIAENTSWSCPHGVERWRADCGCAGGRLVKAKQVWRAPLREALDWLRDVVSEMYIAETAELLKDPWDARNSYIDLILDGSEERVNDFVTDHMLPGVGIEEAHKAIPLLELQRYTMLMYTSCGWFFDDPGDIETIQILQYAGRVIQLAEAYCGVDLEIEFKRRLEEVRSNDPEFGNGALIFDRYVRPNIERHPEKAI